MYIYTMAKLGRPKAFKSPEDLYAEYLNYKEDILKNPIKIKRWVGKDAKQVEEEHYKPPTWQGFEAFLFKAGRIYDLDDYRRNVDGRYSEFKGIIRAIGRDMFDRKFSGASVGIYQHNIIARELGLADVKETHNFERPILEGGKPLPGSSNLPNDELLD